MVSTIGDSLKHRKSGVREEALNIIIASLLTFPSYDFDLAQLCQMLAPTLKDVKRRVRQASLESFAVLAQAMGPSRISPLIHAVDQVELNMEEDGVMKAVQARLARRRLPRLNDDGLVEYATPIPTSATSRNNPTVSKENDVQWIMKGTGSITTGSARERSHADPRSLELSQPSPTRAIPAQTSNQESSPPKRYYSAGKGRSKLPWEDELDSSLEHEDNIPVTNSVSRTHIISSAPTQVSVLRFLNTIKNFTKQRNYTRTCRRLVNRRQSHYQVAIVVTLHPPKGCILHTVVDLLRKEICNYCLTIVLF